MGQFVGADRIAPLCDGGGGSGDAQTLGLLGREFPRNGVKVMVEGFTPAKGFIEEVAADEAVKDRSSLRSR